MTNINPFTPELFVLGAGAGDPELITVKGYKILQQAKVVLYDNLANKELLSLTADSCEKVYVGKQPYGDYTPQESIHDLIKHYAYTKGSVVRLKGGAPFIFGRGFEEILFARRMALLRWKKKAHTDLLADKRNSLSSWRVHLGVLRIKLMVFAVQAVN